MENYTNSHDMPIGLGMALAQNLDAMNYFSSLDRGAQKRIIDHTHVIKSKQEMQAYVESLTTH